MGFHTNANLFIRIRKTTASGFVLTLSFGLLFPQLAGAQAVGLQTSTYAHAEELIRTRQWDEGLSALAPLLQTDPTDLRALNLAGLAFIGKGDAKHADEYFRKAIATDAYFVPALKNLAISEFDSGQLASAEKHLLSAQKIMPADPAINLYLGEIAYRTKNYSLAAGQFVRVRDYISHKPIPEAHLAISYLSMNDTEKATGILDTLAPETVDANTQFELSLALDKAGLHQRALPYLTLLRDRFQDSYDIAFDLMIEDVAVRDFAQAIQTGKDLLAHDRETAEVENVLAQAYEGNAEPQKAFDAYRRAINLDPNDEDNYLDLASLCLNQDSSAAGMQVIEVALTVFPRSARLIFLRGILHAVQGDFELAESDFTLSEHLSPDNALGGIGLGASYLETGHSEQAIAVLRQRLRDKPNDAGLLYLLGESLFRTGASPGSSSYMEAQTALERSTKLNPELCLPHVSLGVLYLNEDRAGDAVVQFEQARMIDPKERSTYSHLAVAYKRSGQPDKAKEVLTVLKRMVDQNLKSESDRMKASPASPAPVDQGKNP